MSRWMIRFVDIGCSSSYCRPFSLRVKSRRWVRRHWRLADHLAHLAAYQRPQASILLPDRIPYKLRRPTERLRSRPIGGDISGFESVSVRPRSAITRLDSGTRTDRCRFDIASVDNVGIEHRLREKRVKKLIFLPGERGKIPSKRDRASGRQVSVGWWQTWLVTNRYGGAQPTVETAARPKVAIPRGSRQGRRQILMSQCRHFWMLCHHHYDKQLIACNAITMGSSLHLNPAYGHTQIDHRSRLLPMKTLTSPSTHPLSCAWSSQPKHWAKIPRIA